ncbi:phosphoribosyltransferase [Cupriavidus taiwanensis]|uniref:phosphoribosyltransferase n=1 Tax=Cupriavidus taiwanensis TaxID=164546 RepID=UPI000E1002CE|nr:phosphoribosyltransferase family protein [Cupriavidus taiwanensis]SOY61339.1 Phosphoribosyltransferase [Cupriavidus taiwanensis]SOY73810.1 Phosphoribosyltransferase [Cupriavidus taiwanensis]SOY97832.1 Phosphoribosyltransferase [Cupriavidus taiwanensis]SOZ67661.1 Phosphoribosyltransferase [Cupriavidus taiwanensis]SOZ84751.1 Phosphoribosyltransferase [Cupriavidus taiwanensis]
MSRYQTRFQTREHAGAELASALRAYRATGALVLAIPRGGVPVARVVADALGADFDLVMARRIDAGVALDDTGKTWRTSGAEADSGFGSLRGPHFDQLCRQRAVYTPVRKPADPGGRVVIVVDDGLVSGATMHAALASLRKRRPARLVCALPIATRTGLDQVRALADEIVCLDTPDRIENLAHFYHEFQLVSDDRVRQLTGMASAPAQVRAGPGAAASVPSLSKAMLIPYGTTRLRAMLESAPNPIGVAVMVHAGGAQRRAARSQYLARKLRAQGLATMLVDLKPDSRVDDAPASEVDELTARLAQALDFLHAGTPFASLPVGLLSAGTAAAAALRAAADSPSPAGAIACMAGRPDLAGDAILRRLETPTLLICASGNPDSIRINHLAFEQMHCPRQLRLVPASGCGFDDRKALADVATLTVDWFERHLAQRPRPCLGYSE